MTAYSASKIQRLRTEARVGLATPMQQRDQTLQPDSDVLYLAFMIARLVAALARPQGKASGPAWRSLISRAALLSAQGQSREQPDFEPVQGEKINHGGPGDGGQQQWSNRWDMPTR